MVEYIILPEKSARTSQNVPHSRSPLVVPRQIAVGHRPRTRHSLHRLDLLHAVRLVVIVADVQPPWTLRRAWPRGTS